MALYWDPTLWDHFIYKRAVQPTDSFLNGHLSQMKNSYCLTPTTKASSRFLLNGDVLIFHSFLHCLLRNETNKCEEFPRKASSRWSSLTPVYQLRPHRFPAVESDDSQKQTGLNLSSNSHSHCCLPQLLLLQIRPVEWRVSALFTTAPAFSVNLPHSDYLWFDLFKLFSSKLKDGLLYVPV